jgi:outer membrane protein assembly factor BamB
VIQGDQIWLTTAVDGGQSLRAICVDRETGAIRHDIEVFRKESPGRVHPKNSHASPTPVIDGDRVYVHFGAHGTACLSTQGEILWRNELAYYHHHGPAASPVLAGGVLFLSCDGFGGPFYDTGERPGIDSTQFVVALEPASGQIRWKRPRQARHSYATALAIEVGGRTQIVSPGGDRVTAYDPATGEELWYGRYAGYSLVPRPVFGHGLLYVCTGYDVPSLIAIRPEGTGDVTESHVAWSTTQGVPLTPSPLIVGNELYLVSDAGVMTCFDAESGRPHWKHRLGGNFSASPLFADGHIYLVGETGTVHVLDPGTKFRKIATSAIEGRAFASPAVAGHSLFLRSERSLYRIEESPSQPAVGERE